MKLPEGVNLFHLSATLQASQKHMNTTPGQFGTRAPEMEDRVRSPITGEKAPESVEEAKGASPAAKARNQQRRKQT